MPVVHIGGVAEVDNDGKAGFLFFARQGDKNARNIPAGRRRFRIVFGLVFFIRTAIEAVAGDFGKPGGVCFKCTVLQSSIGLPSKSQTAKLAPSAVSRPPKFFSS